MIGARLFEHGAEVVLIARGDHLRAILGSGLTVQSPVGAVTLPVPAVAHPSDIAFRDGEDVVLLATKTQDCTQALDDLRRVAGAAIPVVCLNARLQELADQYARERRPPGSLTIEALHRLL